MAPTEPLSSGDPPQGARHTSGPPATRSSVPGGVLWGLWSALGGLLGLLNAVLSRSAVLAIRAYQRCLSPLLPPSCRYTPSCSQYMIEAIRQKGFVVGVLKGVLRILRCNPFFPGGPDPVR